MTTRPKRRKAAGKAAKRSAAKRRVAKKRVAKKRAAGKRAAKKAASKTRGERPARRRKRPGAKASKRAETAAIKPKSAHRREDAGALRHRLALLGASGRRPKAAPRRGPGRARFDLRPRLAKPVIRAPRVPGVAIRGAMGPRYAEVLTPAALRFLADLHRAFAARVQALAGRAPEGSPEPPAGDVTVASPADRQALTDALRAGARILLDFARAAGWAGAIEGQINLKDCCAATREPDDAADPPPVVRPRGWSGVAQLTVDGTPIAAALLDCGLHVFHNGAAPLLLAVPRDGADAPLWDAVLAFAHEQLGLPEGTLRAWPPTGA